MGHGYNINEIKEAIMVCASSTIEIKGEDGKSVMISNIFTAVGLQTKDDWSNHGKKSKAYIQFNPLVSDSIKKKTFRQLNYDTCMSYRLVLARWLHKRMSHNYKQASPNYPYTIKLSTIIRDSGVKQYKQISSNINQVAKALDEMKEKKIILGCEEEKIKDGRKIADVKYTLTPHPHFTSEVMKANKRSAKVLGGYQTPLEKIRKNLEK